MTTPKRGVKVVILTETVDEDGRPSKAPTRVIRKHRPRNGGGLTLGEFSNADGRGVERANAYVEEKGHSLV